MHEDMRTLTPEEERELSLRVKEGDRGAREAMIIHNRPLVISIAKAYCPTRSPNFEDMVGEGTLGLITAVDRFDPATGCKFSTYASYWIRQAIIKSINGKLRYIRLPEHVNRLILKWRKIERQLIAEGTGRTPSAEEIIAAGEFREQDVHFLRQAERTRYVDHIPFNFRMGDPAYVAHVSTQVDEVMEWVGRMEAGDRWFLTLRFGLDGHPPMSNPAVSELGGYATHKSAIRTRALLRQLKEAVH